MGLSLFIACLSILFLWNINIAGAHSHIRGLGLDDALEPRPVCSSVLDWHSDANFGTSETVGVPTAPVVSRLTICKTRVCTFRYMYAMLHQNMFWRQKCSTCVHKLRQFFRDSCHFVGTELVGTNTIIMYQQRSVL